MSKGVYNPTYFENNPEEADIEATLYCVVLVNKMTHKREAIKIGITKGKGWQAALKRSSGFTHHEVRIQKTVTGRLEDIYWLEEYLHEKWSHKSKSMPLAFGGHTECFEISDDIIKSIPSNV